jgi:hydroxyacylglutathione hydrolase
MEARMPDLEIITIACLEDNYTYLVRSGDHCAVIDPAAAEPVDAALKARGWRLTHILNTHHHWDHSGGNRELKAAYGAEVVGPEKDRTRIPAIDTGVDEEQGWRLGDLPVRVLEVPAHTRGAVAYVFGQAVFTGDTMFVMGCGRLFEGSAETMLHSLQKIAGLADDTQVYCGHEYTLTNARFALSIEPGNAALVERAAAMEAARAAGQPTVPSTIALEKATNPFLRTASAEIRANIGMVHGDDAAVFAEIRRRKDNF